MNDHAMVWYAGLSSEDTCLLYNSEASAALSGWKSVLYVNPDSADFEPPLNIAIRLDHQVRPCHRLRIKKPKNSGEGRQCGMNLIRGGVRRWHQQ